MGLIATLGTEAPVAPVEIADEVEMYARESGRHATLHLVPTEFRNGRVASATWVARFTLRPDDPRMRLYQEQRIGDPPTEDVWFHIPKRNAEDWNHAYEPLNIVEMGASGVRNFLEKGNTWSGRGEFDSLTDQLRHVRQENDNSRQKNYDDARYQSRKRQVDKRRSRLKIPFLGVGIDLKKSNQED